MSLKRTTPVLALAVASLTAGATARTVTGDRLARGRRERSPDRGLLRELIEAGRRGKR